MFCFSICIYYTKPAKFLLRGLFCKKAAARFKLRATALLILKAIFFSNRVLGRHSFGVTVTVRWTVMPSRREALPRQLRSPPHGGGLHSSQKNAVFRENLNSRTAFSKIPARRQPSRRRGCPCPARIRAASPRLHGTLREYRILPADRFAFAWLFGL